jgi:uncharacterized protein (TIGR00369 family)
MHFNDYIGIRVLERHDDGVTVECPVRDELMNGAGAVHGGVAATVADSAMGIALWRHLDRKYNIATIEMKINYLRPIATGTIVARAHLIKTGKRVCVGRVDIFDGEKNAIAVALLSYAILSEREAD